MGKMSVKSWADLERQEVVLQIEEDSKPLAHITLDGATTEEVAHKLGKARSALNDEVARELEPNARMEALADPIWRGSGAMTKAGRVVAFRHPGFGWISFAIPDNSASELAKWLTKPLATNE